MSSFWVLFSVVLFGGLFSFPGLLIGVPTFTILYDIVRKLTDFLLNKRGKAEMAEDYRRHYHNPSDDPGLLRENARKFRRDRRHTKEEQKRISELVTEAQESGTTEAAIPVMTVVEEENTTQETAEEAAAAAATDPDAPEASGEPAEENPSPETPVEETPVSSAEAKEKEEAAPTETE